MARIPLVKKPKVSVTLTGKQWEELIHFVQTDIDCMDEGDDNKLDMQNLMQDIRDQVYGN